MTQHESDKTEHPYFKIRTGDLERVCPVKSPMESGGKTDPRIMVTCYTQFSTSPLNLRIYNLK